MSSRGASSSPRLAPSLAALFSFLSTCLRAAEMAGISDTGKRPRRIRLLELGEMCRVPCFGCAMSTLRRESMQSSHQRMMQSAVPEAQGQGPVRELEVTGEQMIKCKTNCGHPCLCRCSREAPATLRWRSRVEPVLGVQNTKCRRV